MDVRSMVIFSRAEMFKPIRGLLAGDFLDRARAT
jgi:hypothetical protein